MVGWRGQDKATCGGAGTNPTHVLQYSPCRAAIGIEANAGSSGAPDGSRNMRRAAASRFETARLRTDGSLVLSRRAVRKASWQPRQEVVVLPIGDALFLVPKQSAVLEASKAISTVLAEEGVTQDQLLADLAEERRRYNREHYPDLYRS